MWTEVHLSDSWHSEVLGQNEMSKRKSNLFEPTEMFEISISSEFHSIQNPFLKQLYAHQAGKNSWMKIV